MAPKRRRTGTYTTPRQTLAAVNARLNQPPAYHVSGKLRTKIRFQVVTGGTYTIVGDNFANLINFPTAAGAAAKRLTNAYRIRRFDMWAPPLSGGGPTSLTFQWVGNTQGLSDQNVVYADTTLGQDTPAHISVKPVKNTSHYNWQIGGNATVCIFQVTTGTIIDLDIEFTMQDAFSVAVPTTTAPGTAAVNVLCCMSLDGGTLIVPQGWLAD